MNWRDQILKMDHVRGRQVKRPKKVDLMGKQVKMELGKQVFDVSV